MAGDVSLTFNLLASDRVTPTIVKVTNNIRMANDAAAASATKAGLAQRAAGLAAQAGSMAAAAGSAIWVSSMASAASWAVAVGAAVSGSIGLIPGVVGAAAASFVGLKLATAGLGAAWQALGKQSTSGGMSAAQAARQVASAQREVTSAQEALARAQRDALAAQKAISDAEETAAKNIRDLNLSLKEAKLDQESATLAVTDAQQALIQAQQSGSPEEIEKANIAYQQSILSLQEAKNKTSDLQESTDKANAAGVEDSDQVVQARQHLADATQAVTDATNRLVDAEANLRQAQQGSGGGAANAAAAAMAKLAPAAQAVIRTLKSLGSTWADMRRQVQQATFAGVSGQIRALSDTYLPVLRVRFTEMGGAFNRTILAFTGMARSKQFVADVNTEIGNTSKSIAILGPALATVVKAFNQIGAVASSFLPGLAGGFANAADRFNAFIANARQTGQLQQWIGTGVQALRDLGRIAGNVARIIGDIFSAGGSAAGQTFLATLATATGRLHAFLQTGQGKQDIVNILSGLRAILGGLVGALGGGNGALLKFEASLNVAGTAMQFLAKHTTILKTLLPALIVAYLGFKTAQGVLTAITVASKLWAAATWLVNAAMGASPIGIVIALIAALVAGVIYAFNHFKWFHDLIMGIWGWIKDHWPLLLDILLGPFGFLINFIVSHWHQITDAIGAAVDWVKTHWPLLLAILTGPFGLAIKWIIDHWNGIMGFFTGLPGRLARAGAHLWDWLQAGLKDAVNGISRALNFVIDQVNHVTHGLSDAWSWAGIPPIPQIPHIPLLATGGDITRAGVAIVGERGPEPVLLPAGARVLPHSAMSGGGGGPTVVELRAAEGDRVAELLLSLLRPVIVQRYGGDPNLAFGGRSY